MHATTPAPFALRLTAALGALFCALAVGLGAYAAHAASEAMRGRLDSAALYLFFHGLALAVFALRQRGIWAGLSLVLWLAGCVLFCGGLVAAALWGLPTTLVPIGGMAFMGGWLARAVALLRNC